MKKILLFSIGIPVLLTSCQGKVDDKKDNNDQRLSKQAIEIHDQIMPQISTFDQTGLKIDSILTNLPAIKQAKPDLDTTNTRTELSTLKKNLEDATDNMMTWMKDYDAVNEDVTYQQKMLDRVTEMKKQFDDVAAQSEKALVPFN